MTINVNIAIIVITMLFQCSTTLATDSDLWFPKQYPSKKLIKCGFDHEMFGLSLVDGYLYQFEKCAVIIYPPPLDKYLDKDLNQLKLEKGYRYTFKEIQPKMKKDYCEYAKHAINIPWLSLTRMKLSSNEHNNHVLLYFIGLLSANDSMKYYVYDFDTNTHIEEMRFIVGEDIRYILATNGDEQFIMHNELYKNRYELIGDPITNKALYSAGWICIRLTSNENYFISRTEYEKCNKKNIELTDSLLKSIVLSFSAYGKILMISKKEEKVLIFDKAILQLHNSLKEFPLYVKPLKGFFFCTAKNPAQSTKSNNLMFIIIPIIIVIIIGIFVSAFTIYRKKHHPDQPSMPLTSSLDFFKKKNRLAKTIRSRLTDTATATTTTNTNTTH